MTRFLVTGGAGFIGSHLTTALVERGDTVRVMDIVGSDQLHNLAHLQVGDMGSGAPVEFLQGDVSNAAQCKQAMQGIAGVLHEAAQVSVPESVADPVRSYEVNVTGTLNLLEAARAEGTQRFLMAASAAAYGDNPTLPKVESMIPEPCSPYASGKVAGEHLLRVWGMCYGMKTVALRYFNVFGPRQADNSPYTGVIAIFARALLEGRAPTIFGDGGQTRDFTCIENVVSANLLALDADLEPGAVINVGGEEKISLNELYEVMAQHLGVDLKPSYAETREGDVRHSLANIDRARNLLGYAPRPNWQEVLCETLDWYAERIAKPA
ncbi:MAG: SDR family NAD(P)-dependent oxidoreductase [Planctomycetota bacterium]|nr:SDR family NAD(P)-dependent oxidoreductase [Planctomycetota bacterium]